MSALATGTSALLVAVAFRYARDSPSTDNNIGLRRSLSLSLRLRLDSAFSDPKGVASKSDTSGDALIASTTGSSGTLANAQFIFGHSTGHSGSTTVHDALKQGGCPWDGHMLNMFERTPERKKEWDFDGDCERTRSAILPFFETKIDAKFGDAAAIEGGSGATYIDLGHFHNRGRVLECLAEILGERATFVRIRRNRYSVANSFLSHRVGFQTTCMVDTRGMKSPTVSLCPRSGERAGPVNLPTSDQVWDEFTPFQRFLWYSDEVEHRWHTLKGMFEDRSGNSGSPHFHEMTWHDGDELTDGIQNLRNELGCTEAKIRNRKKHADHSEEAPSLDCAGMLRQDLEYRRIMGYDAKTSGMLFWQPPFGNLEECKEEPGELRIQLKEYLDAYGFGDGPWQQWVESFGLEASWDRRKQ